MASLAMAEKDTPIDWNEHASGWDEQPETHTYANEVFSLLGPVVASELGSWDELRVLDFGATSDRKAGPPL